MWPFKVIYAPLSLVWLYFALRARVFWFFSNVNPTLEFSGFEGETKKEMYDQLRKDYYPATIYIKGNTGFNELLQLVTSNGFDYPFIVKPDIGMQGMMVRKIRNTQELKDYHAHMDENFLVQEYVDLPYEFSVFYIRYPGESKGKITGFILKEYLQVFGDGRSTLLHLIQRHPKARYKEREMRHMHEGNLNVVLSKGEKFLLSFTGNHNRGAKFINLRKEIDQKLTDVFDRINNEAGQFYFGRYDLKCTSVEDLKAGKNISILEFNGAGAEPNHIYDCGMSYWSAIKVIARHWYDMYRIGKINYNLGIPYWSFKKGKKYLDKTALYFAKIRRYDMQY